MLLLFVSYLRSVYGINGDMRLLLMFPVLASICARDLIRGYTSTPESMNSLSGFLLIRIKHESS